MLKKHIFFFSHTQKKLETLILMYSVISRNGSCLHVLDRTSKPNIVRARPKEPFGLGAKAERPKLMRCISKTKKASRKAPCWLRNKLFFSLSLSSPLMDWSSHGQNFAQNLMKRFPPHFFSMCLRVQ